MQATAVRPWDELSDLEKREAIAARIGWHHPHWVEQRPDVVGEILHITLGPLPDWPSNDGVAFTEVWPKLESLAGELLLTKESGGRRRIGWNDYSGWEYITCDTTWAEAICKAAYELLPEPARK